MRLHAHNYAGTCAAIQCGLKNLIIHRWTEQSPPLDLKVTSDSFKFALSTSTIYIDCTIIMPVCENNGMWDAAAAGSWIRSMASSSRVVQLETKLEAVTSHHSAASVKKTQSLEALKVISEQSSIAEAQASR